MMMTDSEVLYFYRGFAGNAESSRQIADFFKTNYAAVGAGI